MISYRKKQIPVYRDSFDFEAVLFFYESCFKCTKRSKKGYDLPTAISLFFCVSFKGIIAVSFKDILNVKTI